MRHKYGKFLTAALIAAPFGVAACGSSESQAHHHSAKQSNKAKIEQEVYTEEKCPLQSVVTEPGVRESPHETPTQSQRNCEEYYAEKKRTLAKGKVEYEEEQARVKQEEEEAPEKMQENREAIKNVERENRENELRALQAREGG